jgi:hypothetical protein
MKNTIVKLFVLPTLLFLYGCGGGSSESSPSQTTSTQAPSLFSIQDMARDASVSVISVSESLIQVADLVGDILLLNSEVVNISDQSCSNGGFYRLEHIDNDSNNIISINDAVNIRFNQCNVEAVDDVLSGILRLSIKTKYSDKRGYVGDADLSELEFVQSIVTKLSGSLLFKIAWSEFSRKYSIETNNKVNLMIAGENYLSFENTKVERTLDYKIGKYSVTASGVIKRADFNGSYSFSQTTPWSGYILELPYEGEVELKTSDNDIVKISVDGSDLITIINNNGEQIDFWASLAGGAFWSQIDEYNMPGQIFSYGNFRFINVLNKSQLTNFSLLGELNLAFNRTIDSILTTDIYLEKRSPPYNIVPVIIQIDGAILSITPEQPLEPSFEYVLPKLELMSSNGGVVSTLNNIRIKASLNVISTLAVQSNLFTYNDTPLLDASQSQINNSNQISYQWLDISNSGILFESPNAVQTNFSIPETLTENIIVGLQVSNEFGDIAVTQTEINNLEGVETFIAVDSEDGDFIGQGKKWLLTSDNGNFFSRTNNIEQDYIHIDFNGDSQWSLDLRAPSGETLTVRKYIDVAGYPFQSPSEPGLRYSGDGRSCTKGLREFEIYEIEFDTLGELSKLALNFSQSCRDTEPPLHGVVRYNSTYRINF